MHSYKTVGRRERMCVNSHYHFEDSFCNVHEKAWLPYVSRTLGTKVNQFTPAYY